MARIKVACPCCGAALKSDDAPSPSRKLRCPRCNTTFRRPPVPFSGPPPLPPTPTAVSPWRALARAAACATAFCLAALAGVVFLCSRHPADPAGTPTPSTTASARAPQVPPARALLEVYCFRCHGEDGEAEAGVFILDRDKLVAQKKVIPGDPDGSRLVQRLTSAKRPMPPEDETPRPSAANIAQIKEWIASGAPSLDAPAATPAPGALDAGYLLRNLRDHLLKVPEQDRRFQRYFTLGHLANNPDEAKNLPVYRAALAKLLNSLSWKKQIVQPQAVDEAGTVYALDLRELDWDTPDRWQDIVRTYPYGLRYGGPDVALRSLTEEVQRLAGHPQPYVRADWFIATASRPPLYTTLLALPPDARQLEQQLGVDLQADFHSAKLRRAGFLKSNVSSQNRLIERHDSRFGAYWKSYDFRTSQDRDNLVRFPLGPGPSFLSDHPFPEAAFQQAGGEIIFNLPNGLQGYMLVDGRDNRIDVAPIEIVRDREETAGTPQIVTGLSCMACHSSGMITGDNVKDVVREGAAVDGPARAKVEQLYAPPAEMDRLLEKDRERFLHALKKTLAPYPQATEDEPVSAVARPFLKKGIDLKAAAFELGLADPNVLRQAVLNNRTLRQLGLEPLAQGSAISRASWEQVEGGTSVFQQAAAELGVGSPAR